MTVPFLYVKERATAYVTDRDLVWVHAVLPSGMVWSAEQILDLSSLIHTFAAALLLLLS